MSGNISKMLLSDRVHRGLNITKHKFNIFIRSDKCCLRTGRIACRGDLWQKSALPRKSCNADSTCFAFWSLSHQYLEEQLLPLTTNSWRKNFSTSTWRSWHCLSYKLERGRSHECTWWLLVLDYRQGHCTSVHDLQALQVLHNNVVFNQNCQHQPWQPLFLIKAFQLSDATHICKASGSKRLEIRVC